MATFEDDPGISVSRHYYSGLSQGKPKTNWKKFLHRFVLAVLVGAVIGLLYVNWYEAQIIAKQRHIMLEMYYYIQAGCPTSMLQ